MQSACLTCFLNAHQCHILIHVDLLLCAGASPQTGLCYLASQEGTQFEVPEADLHSQFGE